jgi:putative phosphoesterase
MKVGIVSDVHNHATALEYALGHLADCELVLNLGDLVFEYRVDPAIIQIAEGAGLIGIVGNHEKTILKHPSVTLRTRLAPEILGYLESLPASRELQLSGLTILAAHGSPWDDPDDHRCQYVHESNLASLTRLESVAADIILLGHTHVPMLKRVGDKLVINPGTCGDARGPNSRQTFARIDFDERMATVQAICPGDQPERLLHLDFSSFLQ